MTRMNVRTCLTAALLALAPLCAPLAQGPVEADEPREGDWETVLPLPVAEVVPDAFLRSSSYELDPMAQARDNYYHFRVQSDHGGYRVSSQAMLRTRLHEISTIAELRARLDDDGPALDRSPAGRRGVASERVVDILSNPLGTASQLLGNLTYNLEETFSASEESDAADTGGSSSIDLNPDPHKRSAAAQLGVDVYSTNPALQALLDELAAARSAGNPENAISPLVRNVYAERPFGSGVFAQRMESLLKNTAGGDLNALVDGKLERLGVPDEVRVGFVTHPAYTPRSRLFVTAFLEMLDGVDHLDQFVRSANTARTEADALAYVHYLRMLAHYQLTRGDLTEVVTETRFPTLATRGGEAVLPLPLDYLAWTAPVARAADALAELRRTHGFGRFIVLLAGTPTDRAFEELSARDVEVRSRYSF